MSPIFIANWKMHFLLDDASELIEELQATKKREGGLADFIIAPPLPYLSILSNKYPQMQFASQDVSANREFGSYTGEVSASMIKSSGAGYAIVGHSDRRAYIHETNQLVKVKAKNCIDAGITPILCVGESLESRQKKTHLEFIATQVQESFPESGVSDLDHIIVAYEPVWAIGSKITPTTEEIAEVISQIKAILDSSVVAKNISLVYGGSVNSTNYQEILSAEGVSGLLVGSASLDIEEFIRMIKGQ